MSASGDGGRAVLLVVALSSFLTPFAASSFNLALPSMGEEPKDARRRLNGLSIELCRKALRVEEPQV